MPKIMLFPSDTEMKVGTVLGPSLSDYVSDTWLMCDGRPLSVIKYFKLFCVLGYKFGKVHGGLYFLLPDYTTTIGELYRNNATTPASPTPPSFVSRDTTVYYFIKAK